MLYKSITKGWPDNMRSIGAILKESVKASQIAGSVPRPSGVSPSKKARAKAALKALRESTRLAIERGEKQRQLESPIQLPDVHALGGEGVESIQAIKCGTKHLHLRERLKEQNRDRLFARGDVCCYREHWMSPDKSAQFQILQKVRSSTLTMTRGKEVKQIDTGGSSVYEIEDEQALYVKNYDPPVPDPFAHQKNEWLGDALLKYYVRLWLIQKYPRASISQMMHNERPYQTNATLDYYARIRHIPGGADEVEARLGKIFETSTDEAMEMAFDIFSVLEAALNHGDKIS